MERGMRSYATGGDPDCKHENREPGGAGTAASFEHCRDCGATITHPVGNDPFYAAAESANEPRGEY